MENALRVLEVVLSLCLIVAVMMHSAKGEGIGAIGSSARVFGSQKGVEAGLNRLTTVVCTLWGLVALALAFISYHPH